MIAIEQGGSEADELNQEGLCRDCHAWKTKAEIKDHTLGPRLRASGAKTGEAAPQGWMLDERFGPPGFARSLEVA